MAQKKFINIQFPFNDDPEGKFLQMNTDSKRAIKSDLMHILVTNTNERLYMPNFGANLRQYLFDMNDSVSQQAIKNEIAQAIKNFIPNLKVTELTTTQDTEDENAVIVRIDYVVTTAAFQESDFITLKL
jgi:hypothetical protein